MKTVNRIAALILAFSMILPTVFTSFAKEDNSDIVYSKSVSENSDGTYCVETTAYQTGELMPLDIVMVLDVSGSMEYNVAVKTEDIDPSEDYYIEFVWKSTVNGSEVIQGKKYKVTNAAQDGEEAVWTADIEGDTVIATPIEPGTVASEKGEYVFYTGAIDDLKTAATGFVQNIAKSAEENGLDHRVAVVEFSSSQKKSDSSINTHAHSFYANILSGNKTAESALVSVKDSRRELEEVFGGLKAEGPTYSDDALMQAKRIFENSEAEGRRRAVVLFTDGGPGSYGWSSKTVDLDESSIPTANAAISCANEIKSRFDAQIYTIGFFDANENDEEVDRKNKKYLAYVSSNHLSASGMDDSTEPILGGYCYINTSDDDIGEVFDRVSTVLGEGLADLEIRDVVSRYFYLTEEQKKDIVRNYPNAVITLLRDGTTRISIPGTELPQVMVGDDGKPVDPLDEGIFRMTYSVTRRDDFVGGADVPIGSGDSGVYTENGKKLSGCTEPKTAVEVSESAAKELLEVIPLSVTEGDTVNAEDLYENRADSWMANFSTVTYSVTDKDGNDFSSKTVSVSDDGEEFTVRATVKTGNSTLTFEEKVTVRVAADEIVGYEITKEIVKKSYFVGDTLDTDGFEVSAVYKSGKKVPVSETVTFSPTELKNEGTQKITASFGENKVYFDVEVKRIQTVSVVMKSAPKKLRYYVGDEFDPEGIVLTVTKNNGKTETVTEGFECSHGSFTASGTQKVTVTYDGFTLTQNVVVEDVKAVGIEVVSLPNSTSFTYKENPDFTGLSVKVTYNNGETRVVTSQKEMSITRVTKSDVRRGDITFSVSVEEKTATFTMKSQLIWWQWIILILLLGFIWY